MRLIDADALEKDYRSQFESVYKNIRDTVMPSDFYIERKAAYDKELVRFEMEAFFKYLQARPTVDAVEVVRCKECKHRGIVRECPMCYTEDSYDEDYGYDYWDVDKTTDDGFCHCGEMDAEVEG